MAEKNKNHNGDLVPIVKMIKGWNRNINYSFVSFRLELLAIEIFENVTISDYSSGMRYFFDKGRERIKYKAKDPVPYAARRGTFCRCEVAQARELSAHHRIACGQVAGGIGEHPLHVLEQVGDDGVGVIFHSESKYRLVSQSVTCVR